VHGRMRDAAREREEGGERESVVRETGRFGRGRERVRRGRESEDSRVLGF